MLVENRKDILHIDGRKVKELREALRLRQKDLAQLVKGISPGYICVIERNPKTRVSRLTAKRLAAALGVSVEKLEMGGSVVSSPTGASESARKPLILGLDDPEKSLIENALAETAGNQTKAAQIRDVHPNTLNRKIARLRLAECERSLAVALAGTSQFEKALQCFERARALFNRLNLEEHAAQCDMDMGKTLQRMGQGDPAIQHYERARAVYERSVMETEAGVYSENCSNSADRPAEKPNDLPNQAEELRDIEQLGESNNFWATSHPNQLEDPLTAMGESVKEALQKLSPREKDVVLEELMSDLSMSEIAGLLKISEHTVKTLRQRVYKKLTLLLNSLPIAPQKS